MKKSKTSQFIITQIKRSKNTLISTILKFSQEIISFILLLFYFLIMILIYETLIISLNLWSIFVMLLYDYPSYSYYDVCLFFLILISIFVILPFVFYRPFIFTCSHISFVMKKKEDCFNSFLFKRLKLAIKINIILIFIFTILFLYIYFKPFAFVVIFTDNTMFHISFENIPFNLRGIMHVLSLYLIFFNIRLILLFLIGSFVILIVIFKLHKKKV